MICETKGENPLFVFDTFEGLPNLSKEDYTSGLYKGGFKSSFLEVKNYLKLYKKVFIYKGTFENNCNLANKKDFIFIHIDTDLYEPTKKGLEYFYNRMLKGGIFLIHDYAEFKGVKKAVDDFFKDKPEMIIELGSSQCLIIKK